MGWRTTEAMRAGRCVSSQRTWPVTVPVGGGLLGEGGAGEQETKYGSAHWDDSG